VDITEVAVYRYFSNIHWSSDDINILKFEYVATVLKYDVLLIRPKIVLSVKTKTTLLLEQY
jgi:hypothetical protein